MSLILGDALGRALGTLLDPIVVGVLLITALIARDIYRRYRPKS